MPGLASFALHRRRSLAGAVDGMDRGMTDNVPVNQTEGPGEHAAAQEEAVSGATAQTMDPATLGTAFARTHHLLTLEFGDSKEAGSLPSRPGPQRLPTIGRIRLVSRPGAGLPGHCRWRRPC
jgi:hypothetical protein